MVRGSRGYGRGGGGGRGGGSSYRGSGSSNYRSSSGRSSFGNSSYNPRGSYNSNYNYDSRDRDRGPSRHERHDKRSYRNSSRDRSSPDRKRSRHEDSRLSSSYSSYRRNESSRSNRQTPPPPSVRSSSAPYRRDDSSSHRHSSVNDSMGPPKSLPPRSGRIIRPRGGASSHIRGSSTRGSSLRIIRHSRESTDMRIMRKKLLLANQRDRARRIKIAKLTSSLRGKRREVLPRKTIRKPRGDKKDDDESKNDEDEDDDAENKSKEDDNEDETGDGEKGEEQKIKKEPKKEKEGKNDDEDEEGGSDVEPTTDDKDDEAEEKEDDTESKSKRDRDLKPRRPRKTFIKLTCVHCRSKCLTFKEYSNHLYSRSHKLAMRRLALRQKAQLAHMRLTQRNAQRDIEEKSKDEIDDCKSQYCLLCRLNYRQPKAKHQLSESHRSMKKFLMPYCSTCHIAFKSPMVYETHRCSLEHIKRKARNNESANSESSDGEKEVDLTNFMTVDSIGEIDGVEGDDKHEGDDAKEKINVGSEHVKKVEVFYCDLCRYYVPFKDDEEALVKKHCGTRSHLKAFVRFKEDENLRLEAERIQRRQKEAKEKKKEASEKAAAAAAAAAASATEKDAENGEENEEGGEDKIWEDVDKDLGDLLREVGPDGDHEDDEEDGSVLNINIERFDRFKNSEKQKQKELNGNGTEETAEQKVEEKANEPVTPIKIKKEVVDKKSEATPKNEEKSNVEVK